MREKIENELGRLESNDIIKKVEHSDWATPIVPVLKKDGTVRICGDYKITVNNSASNLPHFCGFPQFCPFPLISACQTETRGSRLEEKISPSSPVDLRIFRHH